MEIERHEEKWVIYTRVIIVEMDQKKRSKLEGILDISQKPLLPG